ncbi:CBS domain containing protein [Solidesulfovibrio fructosivorans JJ]]|uniref:CBS domain containing protein n=1 Tax=Solidesulfovibrio fructosivorans JJ] TaxID=596151 RepID=E1JWG3_SOLFR|nr:hemolysin family protein [Solidesulfovibrio fructosivorans]EFL51260.1 CBS domain containing protein [Solidesulfovibrio fructosivorans JJ]]
MDDDSDSRFWGALGKFFRQKSISIEELILEAKAEGTLIQEDASMLLNILRLEKKQVFDIMIPRPDIVCAEADDGIPAICDLIRTHGHSRIPVYEGNRDNILGIVYAKDLLSHIVGAQGEMPDPRAIMRAPLFVPETLDLKRMLLEFRSQKKHMAVALDEYGGTSGLITLEDVLEEIVGEIEDEHDPSKPEEIQETGPGVYRVSGRFPLEDLNAALGLDLESEQVETIGGFLTELAGRVPRQGDAFTLEGRRFTIREADRRQIRWIAIEPAA